MRPARFTFGRLNLIAQFDDKGDFLMQGLRSKLLRRVREHLWGFFDVEPIPDSSGYFTGYLAKLRPSQDEEIGDLNTHELSSTSVENRIIAKSRFFLQVETGIVAYQFVSQHIPAEIFREQFCRLFEDALQNFFVSAEIQVIEDRLRFLEALAAFERVLDISFSLHPTNPHYDEVYRRLDERLKKLKVKTYKETYNTNFHSDGLAVLEDQEIRSKVTMAEDGYGEATASGVRDGSVQRISSKENPITANAVVHERSPSDILNDLMSSFVRIIGRISQ
jgi:hypothetical protein